jgi:hypothetical protein
MHAFCATWTEILSLKTDKLRIRRPRRETPRIPQVTRYEQVTTNNFARDFFLTWKP